MRGKQTRAKGYFHRMRFFLHPLLLVLFACGPTYGQVLFRTQEEMLASGLASTTTYVLASNDPEADEVLQEALSQTWDITKELVFLPKDAEEPDRMDPKHSFLSFESVDRTCPEAMWVFFQGHPEWALHGSGKFRIERSLIVAIPLDMAYERLELRYPYMVQAMLDVIQLGRQGVQASSRSVPAELSMGASKLKGKILVYLPSRISEKELKRLMADYPGRVMPMDVAGIREITRNADPGYALYSPVLGRSRYTLLVHDVETRKVLFATMRSYNCANDLSGKTPWVGCAKELAIAVER
jgi:hypothetical protein